MRRKRDSQFQPVRALATGADFLLTKPFDGERFADVIGSLVG